MSDHQYKQVHDFIRSQAPWGMGNDIALACLDTLKRERDEARAEIERLRTYAEQLRATLDCGDTENERLRAAIREHRENVPEYVVTSVDRKLWAVLEESK